MKLNLGCGNDIEAGYINIDIRDIPGAKKHDVRNLPYRGVDEIIALDVYEHISWRESESLIRHWVEVLKKGGRLIIQTTDIKGVVKKHLQGFPNERLISRIFGGQDYPENTHLTIGDFDLIKSYLLNAGVRGKIDVIHNYGNGTNMLITAIK